MGKSTNLGHFYQRTFTCLVDGGTFEVFRMKPTPKRQFGRRDEFLDVDYYDPDPEGPFTNILHQDVVACPTCGFASAEDRFFQGPSRFIDSVEFDSMLKKGIAQGTEERLQVLRQSEDLYRFPRTLDDALLSYELAIATSRTLLALDRRRFTSEARRIASYAFKAARIAKQDGRDDLELPWLRRAHEALHDAIEVVLDGSSLYRSFYQVIALSIRIEEDRSAIQMLHRMRTMCNESPTKELEMFLGRAQSIWEDREYHRDGERQTSS